MILVTGGAGFIGANLIKKINRRGDTNLIIVDNIKKKITDSVKLVDDFNFNGDFIESQAFAYLAIRSYLKKFITFPTTTGAKKPSLGGTIFKS